jgi:exocyst complex protein 7
MLSSIDSRLGKLETVILPIHSTTQKLTKMEERIQQGKSMVFSIVDLLSAVQKEEPIIQKLNPKEDLDGYIACLKRIKESIQKLSQLKYKSAEMTLNQLVIFPIIYIYIYIILINTHPSLSTERITKNRNSKT